MAPRAPAATRCPATRAMAAAAAPVAAPAITEVMKVCVGSRVVASAFLIICASARQALPCPHPLQMNGSSTHHPTDSPLLEIALQDYEALCSKLREVSALGGISGLLGCEWPERSSWHGSQKAPCTDARRWPLQLFPRPAVQQLPAFQQHFYLPLLAVCRG